MYWVAEAATLGSPWFLANSRSVWMFFLGQPELLKDPPENAHNLSQLTSLGLPAKISPSWVSLSNFPIFPSILKKMHISLNRPQPYT
jgi:hypothetical protein